MNNGEYYQPIEIRLVSERVDERLYPVRPNQISILFQ